ncbi:MAG: serine/threonine-protein kinase [Sulfuricellaceae bacterium]|nr:serine/threonine-protein kinase [Sulfuricellaceae bacterium]
MGNSKIGRYEILSEIGRGAMGVVYRARDPMLQRVVAIKTINLALSKDERIDFESRFYREAGSAGRLNHPNIVTIYDVGDTGELAYMAMEFLEGEELRDLLDSGKPLPLERVVEIAAGVARGLAFAHEHGVVHRDIKPSNVMILKNGVVKITDFGIALIPAASRTMAGMILGSPKYMSPEQVIGKDVDGRADIFSLGVVLFEMLTGQTPFDGENISALMYRILNDTPALPGSLRAGLPAAFDHIVSRALAKLPDDRYQTAAEMAEDLLNYKELEFNAQTSPMGERKNALDHSKPQSLSEKLIHEDEQTAIMARSEPLSTHIRSSGFWKKIVALSVLVMAMAGWLLFHQPDDTGVERTSPSPQAAQTVPVATGDLSIAISPWGEIIVDGKNEGISPPLNTLNLAAGKHKVEIRNPGHHSVISTVDIPPGGQIKIRHKFD